MKFQPSSLRLPLLTLGVLFLGSACSPSNPLAGTKLNQEGPLSLDFPGNEFNTATGWGNGFNEDGRCDTWERTQEETPPAECRNVTSAGTSTS